MSASSSIEWCDSTWNPVRGCTRVSEGCKNCYAEVMAARFSNPGQWGHGFAEMKRGDHRWTHKVALIEDHLTLPLHWKKPRRIFVNSTSDLFHESLPDEAIDRVFAVMALCPQHTFQVLTKRPGRMRAWFARDADDRTWRAQFDVAKTEALPVTDWPLPNVWLCTSVEDQSTADERIPHLLATPAAVRGVSYEPALGPVNFRWANWDEWEDHPNRKEANEIDELDGLRMLDWIIMGGESGPGARPMHPDWARSVRDQCAAAGVAFFFKQWGEWHPCEMKDGVCYAMSGHAPFNSWKAPVFDPDIETGWNWRRLGKKRAGRLLDGLEHNAFPSPQQRREAA